MSVRRGLPALVMLLCAVAWLGLLACSAAHAESLREAWRSPFGRARGVSVNRTDGSCWAATGASVMHVSEAGAVLSQTDGLRTPTAVSVNPTDGSCWVADVDAGEVLLLGADGSVRWRGGGFDHPVSVSVNLEDGSCWVACQGTYDLDDPHLYLGSAVVHVAADGSELWRGADFNGPTDVSVNPGDGSCWVGSVGSYNTFTHEWVGSVPVHLAEDGTRLWEGTGFWSPAYVSVNTTDDSCWISDTSNEQLVHVSANGAQLWRGGTLIPEAISVNPTDGSLWAFDWDARAVVHLAVDGTELWRSGADTFCCPIDVSVNPQDGSCWVADYGRARVFHLDAGGGEMLSAAGFSELGQITADATDSSCWVVDHGLGDGVLVHVAADGSELWRRQDESVPVSVAIDSSDGSFWLARLVFGSPPAEVLHLSRDGVELTRVGGFYEPTSLAVDPADRSCWVADIGVALPGTHVHANSSVAHLAVDGGEIWRGWDYQGAASLSLSPVDRSCWVADVGANEVVRLSAEGDELWRGGGFSYPDCVSVSPTDGSCWVTDCDHHEVARLSPEGDELWRGAVFLYPHSVSADPSDGSCWVASNGDGPLRHLAVDGTELWRDYDFLAAGAVSVDPIDRSVWVTDSGNSQLVHLIRSRFPDVPFDHWAYSDIEACVDAGIVQGFDDGSYQPGLSVTRDAMAVYIARALAMPTGDIAIPTGPATFVDVPNTGYGESETEAYWAYQYIEYCVHQGIVQGYDDTHYNPGDVVTRDQMAVFLARAKGWVQAGDDMTTAPELFADVPAGFWCGAAVQACVEHNVVQGYADGTYGPGNPVTRDQMAVYIQRAFGLPL